MQAVKDQTTLAHAFVRTVRLRPALADTLRLVMVGDGPLRRPSQDILEQAGLSQLAWLPGEREDVDIVLRGLDCFVLPSLAEGISNTILEAMASGLPIVATSVGGNAELVSDGDTGLVVVPGEPDAMARALLHLATDPERAARMGSAGRQRVEERFSLQLMVSAYQKLYDSQLNRSPRRRL